MNRRGFEALRRSITNALVAAFYALAPSYVPAWRLDPRVGVAYVLPIGEPTPSIGGRGAVGLDQSPG